MIYRASHTGNLAVSDHFGPRRTRSAADPAAEAAKTPQSSSPPTLRADQVDAVVCTGGSSRIPAVRRRVESLLPAPVVEHDSFTSIAAGLALASYQGYDWSN